MPDLVHAAMHQSILVMAHTAQQGVQLHRLAYASHMYHLINTTSR